MFDAILAAQHGADFRVENLPRELARLAQDHRAVFRISEIAEVRAFIDEALAVGIDHHAERIGMLLEIVADRRSPKSGALRSQPTAWQPDQLPADGADIERHLQAIARIEPRAAHLRQIPAGAEIARAPFRVRFKSAAGEHHGPGRDLLRAPALAHAHALHATVVRDQGERARFKRDLDSILCASSRAETKPGPPPQASTVSPPQNLNLPSTL